MAASEMRTNLRTACCSVDEELSMAPGMMEAYLAPERGDECDWMVCGWVGFAIGGAV